MRNRFHKSIMLISTIINLILLSCATTQPGRHYTQGNIIDMGHFSIIGPSGEGWVVNIKKDQETIEFQKRNVSQSTGLLNDITMIKVFRNWITEERFMPSEEEVADDFRKMEEEGMIRMGVMKGVYELTDVKKDTTVIGGKKLYFMSYRTSGVGKPVPRKWESEAVLYLFFPPDFKEKHLFYCFLIQQTKMEGLFGTYDLTPIIPVIKSLQIK